MVDGSFGTLNTKRSFQIHGSFFCHVFIFCPLSHQKILSLSQKDLFIVTYYFLSTVTLKDLFSCSKNISFMSHIYFSFQSHRSVWGPYSKKNSELFPHLLQPLQIYLQPVLLSEAFRMGTFPGASVSSAVVLTVGDDVEHCFQGLVRTSKYGKYGYAE